MTDQWILLHSVAIDCILSLLHNFSYLLPCNKPPPNVVTWNINIYLCLILNLGRTQGRWFISALCGSVGVTHVNVFSCKLSLGCHIKAVSHHSGPLYIWPLHQQPERENSRRISPSVQMLIMLLLASHLLMSYWPKLITWLSLEGGRKGAFQRPGC